MEKELALAFDDILLLPGASSVLPRDAELKTKLTKSLSLNIPLLAAAMDTVTESKTAIAMARQGGIGIIHRNMSSEKEAEEVRKVKRSEFWIIHNPVTLQANESLAKIFELRKNLGIGSFPVIDENKKLVGIVTRRDLWLENNPETKVSEIMAKDLITVSNFVSTEKAKEILHKHKIEKLPIIDSKGRLKGLITASDIEKKEKFPNALKDKGGRLLVGAAIGPSPKEMNRLEKLIEAEADVIVLDTAHGHSKMVIDATKKIKKEFGIELIVGNVATAKATEDLIAAGADAVKVGVGPGSICTTRIIAGVGVPQFSAVLDCAKAAEKYGCPVIADGGVRYSGDIVKAIAAGASSVMIGSLFAGCEETPGRIVFLAGRKFKQYRGMGSLGAMTERKDSNVSDRYFQGKELGESKLVPEGVEGLVSYRGAISEVVFHLLGGLRSGMGMIGAKTIENLKKEAKWRRITTAGLRESHPHDVTITEESPTYE
jgi:IMP dehydrogenase